MPQLCMNPSLLLFHNPVLARFARPMHAIIGYKEGGSIKDSERFVSMLFTDFKYFHFKTCNFIFSLLIKNQIWFCDMDFIISSIFYINVAVLNTISLLL